MHCEEMVVRRVFARAAYCFKLEQTRRSLALSLGYCIVDRVLRSSNNTERKMGRSQHFLSWSDETRAFESINFYKRNSNGLNAGLVTIGVLFCYQLLQALCCITRRRALFRHIRIPQRSRNQFKSNRYACLLVMEHFHYRAISLAQSERKKAYKWYRSATWLRTNAHSISIHIIIHYGFVFDV